MAWSVLASLSGQQGEIYSLLHHTLLDTILRDGTKVPPKYLVHLTGEQDRFSQLLGAVVRDLMTLVNQLPANRLIHIVLANIS